jgi:phage portal protein BeeE
MGREFLTFCLEPWLKALESAFQRAFFYSAEDRGRYLVRFDRDDMTRADFSTRATVVNTLLSSKVINPNEGRAWFGYGPRPGGEVYENPNINPEAGGQKPAEEPDEEAGGEGADNQPD